MTTNTINISVEGYPNNPLKSLRNTVVFGAKDWSVDKRDAWIYGIIVGWNDESLENLAKKYHWSPEHIQRLKRLNARFKQLAHYEVV